MEEGPGHETHFIALVRQLLKSNRTSTTVGALWISKQLGYLFSVRSPSLSISQVGSVQRPLPVGSIVCCLSGPPRVYASQYAWREGTSNAVEQALSLSANEACSIDIVDHPNRNLVSSNAEKHSRVLVCILC